MGSAAALDDGAASVAVYCSAAGGVNWNGLGSAPAGAAASVGEGTACVFPTPLMSGTLGRANAVGAARPTPSAARPATATVVRIPRRAKFSMVDPFRAGVSA